MRRAGNRTLGSRKVLASSAALVGGRQIEGKTGCCRPGLRATQEEPAAASSPSPGGPNPASGAPRQHHPSRREARPDPAGNTAPATGEPPLPGEGIAGIFVRKPVDSVCRTAPSLCTIWGKWVDIKGG